MNFSTPLNAQLARNRAAWLLQQTTEPSNESSPLPETRSSSQIPISLGGALTGAMTQISTPDPSSLLVGATFGLAAASLLIIVQKRIREMHRERQTLLELPLLLESLLLLIEGGLGLLPALERVVQTDSEDTLTDGVRATFKRIHDVSLRGVPLTEALRSAAEETDSRVLQHVLLHLDIAGNEGGPLVPALRSLAGYAHTEWKTSVETRVRKLENLVVFPVFGAVIGLIFVSAAVPLVPLMELKEKIEAQEQLSGGPQ